jgi:hypothetical protein
MAQSTARILLIGLLALAPAANAAPSLWDVYRRHDVFALHVALQFHPKQDARSAFLHTADAVAFGRYEEASDALRSLLTQPNLDRTLETDARELLMLSERATFHYSAALDAAKPLLPQGDAEVPAQLASIRNRAALLAAIVDVRPEIVHRGNRIAQTLTLNGEVATRVNDLPLDLAFDTGANYSILSRSAAQNASLAVRGTGYELEGASGAVIRSDIASGTLRFGDGTVVSNVVFLVLPDVALRSPGGRALAGIIGFPVISALGAIQHLRSDRIVFAGSIGHSDSRTDLALSGSDPILQIEYRGQHLTCRLDTGAAETVFYEPFLRAFPDLVSGIPGSHDRLAGVGGVSAVGDYELPALRIGLAGQSVQLHKVHVLVQSSNQDGGGTFCNIGRDALDYLGGYTINFSEMTFSVP